MIKLSLNVMFKNLQLFLKSTNQIKNNVLLLAV